MVCPDDSAVDHLHGVLAATLGEGFKHQVPQSGGRPTTVLPVYRVPVAEFPRQIAPRCSRSSNPKHRVQRLAVVGRRTPPQGTTLNHERLEERPLVVA
jgi:hypothetical protein